MTAPLLNPDLIADAVTLATARQRQTVTDRAGLLLQLLWGVRDAADPVGALRSVARDLDALTLGLLQTLQPHPGTECSRTPLDAQYDAHMCFHDHDEG